MTSHELIFMLLGFSLALIVSNARKDWMIAKQDKLYRSLVDHKTEILVHRRYKYNPDPVIEAEKARQFFNERPEVEHRG